MYQRKLPQSSSKDAAAPGPCSHRLCGASSARLKLDGRDQSLREDRPTPAPRRGHPRQTKPSAALRGVAGGRRAPGRAGRRKGGCSEEHARSHPRGPPPCPARTGRPAAQTTHGACAQRARPRPPGAPEPQRREPQSPGASRQLPEGCPPPGEETRVGGERGRGRTRGRAAPPPLRAATHARLPRPGTSSSGFPRAAWGRGGA